MQTVTTLPGALFVLVVGGLGVSYLVTSWAPVVRAVRHVRRIAKAARP
ncbi:MAG TPA: hypothetical protein VF120_03020 [Ktedonobacterales bacterium]